MSLENDKDTISLLDLVLVIAKRWRFIAVFTAVFMVLVVLLSVYTLKMPPDSPFNPLPNLYRPEVKIRLQDSASSNTLSNILKSSEFSFLAGISDISGSGSKNSDLAQALLTGNALLDQIAEEFRFIEKYDLDKYPKTVAREMIRESMKSDFQSSTGILTISYQDIDPEFATAIINRSLDLLEKRFQELTLERVGTKKLFLEERIDEIGLEVRRAQQNLIDFQQKYGIVNIEIQAESQITELAKLNSEIIALEMEIKALLQYRREEDPQILRLRKDLELKRYLLEMKKSGFTAFSSEDIPTTKLPEISAVYFNLRRDLTIQETIFASLRQQYETTKMEEADDSKIFQIIERAEIPERKASPSRGKICVITSLAAFFLSVFVSFIMEYLERVKADPIESQKLRAIKQKFTSTKSRE